MMGDDWQVITGDCLEVMRGMGNKSARLVFADPPYNNGTAYHGYNDNRADYDLWCAAWFAECRRIGERVIITPGHGNLWMWPTIEKPWGVGCWYKPGNPATSVLGWVTWEPWLFYGTGSTVLGGPDTIRATVSKQKDVGDHPCPKPLDLLTQLIEKATKPGDIVIDPFTGSGTTGVAAIQTGRRFLGIEIDEGYADIARARIAKAAEQARQEPLPL